MLWRKDLLRKRIQLLKASGLALPLQVKPCVHSSRTSRTPITASDQRAVAASRISELQVARIRASPGRQAGLG